MRALTVISVLFDYTTPIDIETHGYDPAVSTTDDDDTTVTY